MAGTTSPPFDRQKLARFLAAASGAATVAIEAVEWLPGGAIGENWGIDAAFEGGRLAGRQRLVLRTDGPTGIASSLGRVEEYAVLRAARAAGVSVPEPLFAGADLGVIGRPFFVMRRLAGTAQGRRITTDPALEPHLPDIAERLGRELALIQTIRPPRPDLAFLPPPEASTPARQIAEFRTYLDRHPRPRPVLEWGLRWLETHVPALLPPVLCHRDFRTGNYLLDGGDLTGILDWEFARWGDPDEDIGWFCCKGWRFARLDRAAGGIAERAHFYRGYEAASGRRLDPERVKFWEVFANCRWAVIALQQSDRYLIGGEQSLGTAIIGRRATECDLELLILLDPDGGPQPSCLGAGGTPAVQGSIRDLPAGAELLDLARQLLLEELTPLLPLERGRDAHLVATAIAIAAREASAGQGWQPEIERSSAELYGDANRALSALQGGEGGDPSRSDGEGEVGVGERPGIPHLTPALSAPKGAEGEPDRLLRRLAGDLRRGEFETNPSRQGAARAILWRLTIAKLREGNPQFLADNGFAQVPG